MTHRELSHRQAAIPASDGDGVRLRRVFGGGNGARFDPFLMLDEFGSDRPEDYQGGFPDHPHRGFMTVTYMLEGRMEHRDHLGNVGLLESGGVQWMTAGRGIVHSEMPLQRDGLMHGFQLWVNLPAKSKLQEPGYQDVPGPDIPRHEMPGAVVMGIAGTLAINGQPLAGYFNPVEPEVILADIRLAPGAELDIRLPASHRAMVYPYGGSLVVGERGAPLEAQQLGVLSAGDRLRLGSGADSEVRLLLLSGAPIGEPVVQYGPFVMNTEEEIHQALQDYRSGRFP